MINSKTIDFGLQNKLSTNYWIRLELLSPLFNQEVVTVSEASEVIDSVFDVDVCGTSSAQIGGLPAPDWMIQGDVEEANSRLNAAFSNISYNPCVFEPGSANYYVDILVFRSHVNLDYKLVLNVGKEASRRIQTKQVHEFVRFENGIGSASYPIINVIDCDKEVKEISGDNIQINSEYSGILAVKYETQYDIVTLFVNESPIGLPQKAHCIAFFHGVTDTIDIEHPQIDYNSVQNIGCNPDVSETKKDEEEEDPYNGPCYQRYIYNQFCSCDRTNLRSVKDEVRVVACPDNAAIPHSDTEQGVYNFHWQAKTIDWYISCPDLAPEDVGDPEFYIEKCCKTHTQNGVTLPKCKTFMQNWTGGSEIVRGRDFYINNALSNQKVILIPVSPDGLCGEIEIVQDVEAENCCDDPDLVPITINGDYSADVIADDSSGVIRFYGGKGTITIKVSGQGFFLDPLYTKKQIIHEYKPYVTGTSRSFVVYTEDACGVCIVEVTDECTTDTYKLKSTNGRWVEIDSGQSVINKYKGSPGTYDPNGGNLWYYESGDRRVYQYVAARSYMGSSFRSTEAEYGCHLRCDYFHDTWCEGLEQPGSIWGFWDTNGCLSVTWGNGYPDIMFECHQNDCNQCLQKIEPTGCNPDGVCYYSHSLSAKSYQLPKEYEWQC